MNIPAKITSSSKEILRIGLPAVLEYLATTLTGMIDSRMVSDLGVKAISAVSVTNQPKLFLLSILFALNTAVSVLVAQKYGGKDRRSANATFFSAAELSCLLSVIMGILCVALARPIMQLCSGQEDTLSDSVLYFRIVMGGILFNGLFTLNNATLRGIGKTTVTLISNLISCGVNILFNFLLISGRFGFPAWGIAGAAAATVLGTAAAQLYTLLYLYLKSDCFISLRYCFRNRLHLCLDSFREIAAIWKHITLENLLSRLGFLITGSITARIGSFDTALYSIGQHLLNLNFALGNGLQIAAVALVGRSMGENDRDKLHNYARKLLFYGLVSAGILSAIIAVLATPYCRGFSDQPLFLQYGRIVCWIVAAISPIQTIKIILTGLLQGIGKARVCKNAAVIAATFTQPIFNYVLTILLGLGLWGSWGSIFISQTTWFLCLYLPYRRERRAGGLFSADLIQQEAALDK